MDHLWVGILGTVMAFVVGPRLWQFAQAWILDWTTTDELKLRLACERAIATGAVDATRLLEIIDRARPSWTTVHWQWLIFGLQSLIEDDPRRVQRSVELRRLVDALLAEDEPVAVHQLMQKIWQQALAGYQRGLVSQMTDLQRQAVLVEGRLAAASAVDDDNVPVFLRDAAGFRLGRGRSS